MADDSKLTLPRWLAKMLTSGQYPGLEMLDPDQLTFKIPWQNQKSGGLKPESDDTIFLRAWATHKNYKGTDPKIWKQNFSCALNKFRKDVQLVRKEKNYRIYKFLSYPSLENEDLQCCTRKRKCQKESEDGKCGIEEPVGEYVQEDHALSEISGNDLFCSLPARTTISRNWEVPDIGVQTSDTNLPADLDGLEGLSGFPTMEVEVRYDLSHTVVQTVNIPSGVPHCQIFYDPRQPEGVTDTGSSQEFQISLPTPNSCDKKSQDHMMDILKDFYKGVRIKYQEDDIYIERKCTIHVFYSDGVFKSERLTLNRQKSDSASEEDFKLVFDFKDFLEKLERYKRNRHEPYPKDYFILTLGNEIVPGDAQPMKHVLVALRVRHVQAAYYLFNTARLHTQLPRPLRSDFDSIDTLLEIFKNIKLREDQPQKKMKPTLNLNDRDASLLRKLEGSSNTPSSFGCPLDAVGVSDQHTTHSVLSVLTPATETSTPSLPLMHVQVYYRSIKNPVIDIEVSSPSCKIFYDNVKANPVPDVWGPDAGEFSIPLPQLESLPVCSKTRPTLQSYLSNFARGLSLRYKDDDIYVERRSNVCVFYWDGASQSKKLTRRKGRSAKPVYEKGFDFAAFRAKLERCADDSSIPTPRDHFYLVIGMDIVHDDLRPLRDAGVWVKVRNMKAALYGELYRCVPDKIPGPLSSLTGSIESAAQNGSLESPLQNGSLMSPSQNGSLISPSQNGSLMSPSQNGSLMSPSQNGSLMSTSQNGSLMSPSQNGSLMSPLQNGSLISPSQNGSLMSTSQNGSLMSLSQNGSLMSPSQNESLMLPSQNGSLMSPSQNESLMSPSQNGSLMSPSQNGSLMSPSQNGSLMSHSQNGSLMSPSQNGSLMSPSQNGCLMSPSQNGSLMSPSQNGSFVSPPENGNSISSSQNGTPVSTSKNENTILSIMDEGNLDITKWFVKIIRSKQCPGLRMVDEKRFQIPWMNQKSRQWKQNQSDSQIFKLWAAHKYGFKDGDVEDLPKWKTNLRCAINKSKGIQRIKEQDNKTGDNQYIMCQFTADSINYMLGPGENAIDGAHFANTLSSPIGSSTPHPIRTNSNVSASSSSTLSTSDYFSQSDSQDPTGYNIPLPVLDEAVNYLNSDTPNISSDSFDLLDYLETSQMGSPALGFNIPCDEQMDTLDSNLVCPSLQAVSGTLPELYQQVGCETLAQTNKQVGHGNSPQPYQQGRAPGNQNQTLVNGASYPQNVGLTDGASYQQNAGVTNGASYPQNAGVTNGASYPQNAGVTNGAGYPQNVGLTNGLDQSQNVNMPDNTLMSQPPAAAITPEPWMILEVAYDTPSRPVMSVSVNEQKCRIFCGHYNHPVVQNLANPYPDEWAVELPHIKSLDDFPDKNKDKIMRMLDNFERGIVLQNVHGDIWVERRSHLITFYTDSKTHCTPVPRKKHSNEQTIHTKIFDYQKFLKDLNDYTCDTTLSCPKDYVLLTLGNEYKLNVASPLSKVLVNIKVRHLQASKDLSVISGGDNSANPMFSNPDSFDRIAENFKNIDLNK
ncbi:uncharacterized protein LOC131955267 [Physella acuta]|uniref:uncharacterized protein LOC131955267 n=1 Tax=Physella acuta TaxID=109671 RepID=UPI0027DE3CE6|nr:uncharacterized protein LOC131955267 [Physella acuta]